MLSLFSRGDDNASDKSENEDEESSQRLMPDLELIELKAGDYMIHVFLEDIRKLNIPDEESLNVILKVTCFGQT